MSTKRFTRVEVTLPEHSIEYTGLSRREAVVAAQRARAAGRSASVERARVTGSTKRDKLFHYTVWSFPQKRLSNLDRYLRDNLRRARRIAK